MSDIIGYGLECLPPVSDTSAAVADTWEKLGPAPDVLYDKLQARGRSPGGPEVAG